MKYLIHDWGMEKFRAKVEEYYGEPLTDPRPVVVADVEDHIGWHEQGDGRWFYGLHVDNGRGHRSRRLQHENGHSADLRAAQTQLEYHCPSERAVHRLAPEQRDPLETILRTNGVKLDGRSRRFDAGRWPASRCRLAAGGNRSERIMPDVMAQIEADLGRLGWKTKNSPCE